MRQSIYESEAATHGERHHDPRAMAPTTRARRLLLGRPSGEYSWSVRHTRPSSRTRSSLRDVDEEPAHDALG
jgi:hypothetical protein